MIDLTILIISYKSLEKLNECIQTIGKNKKILVVENSNNIQIKNELEKKYPNCEVYLNNSNLGYSKASNIGFSKIKTDYALLLNTDIKISEEQINEIEKEVKNIGTRFILGSPLSDDLVDFNKNNKLDKYFDEESLDLNSTNNSTKVDLIKGCSLVVNLKKFENRKVFDENFFFFFEEMDLCRNIKKRKEEIYVFNQIKIEHKSAQSLDESYNENYQNFRNWNYFWGRFYYFKKHYGYIYSLSKHTSKLIRFFFNMVRYFLFSKTLYNKNKYRFLGLTNSIIGKKSSISSKILEK
tara:strand:- start:83 stop:967 length:885 start_codon:yes stop_codon:yes gene_type:complete